jgi:hypothetical protein
MSHVCSQFSLAKYSSSRENGNDGVHWKLAEDSIAVCWCGTASERIIATSPCKNVECGERKTRFLNMTWDGIDSEILNRLRLPHTGPRSSCHRKQGKNETLTASQSLTMTDYSPLVQHVIARHFAIRQEKSECSPPFLKIDHCVGTISEGADESVQGTTSHQQQKEYHGRDQCVPLRRTESSDPSLGRIEMIWIRMTLLVSSWQSSTCAVYMIVAGQGSRAPFCVAMSIHVFYSLRKEKDT